MRVLVQSRNSTPHAGTQRLWFCQESEMTVFTRVKDAVAWVSDLPRSDFHLALQERQRKRD